MNEDGSMSTRQRWLGRISIDRSESGPCHVKKNDIRSYSRSLTIVLWTWCYCAIVLSDSDSLYSRCVLRTLSSVRQCSDTIRLAEQ